MIVGLSEVVCLPSCLSLCKQLEIGSGTSSSCRFEIATTFKGAQDSWIAASVFSATGAMTTFVRDSQWNLGAMFLAEMLQMQAITSTCADQSSRSMLHNAAISALMPIKLKR